MECGRGPGRQAGGLARAQSSSQLASGQAGEGGRLTAPQMLMLFWIFVLTSLFFIIVIEGEWRKLKDNHRRVIREKEIIQVITQAVTQAVTQVVTKVINQLKGLCLFSKFIMVTL